MALQRQVVPIPFGRGVNTKDDPLQLPPTKLVLLENGYFLNPNSIKKRPGYTAYALNWVSVRNSFTGSIAAASGVWPYGNELTLGDGDFFYSLSPSGGKWSQVGRMASASLTTRSIRRDLYQKYTPDVAVSGNFVLVSCEGSSDGGSINTSIKVDVYDSATGGLIANKVNNGSWAGSRSKAVAIGTSIYVVYFDAITTKLRAVAFSTATPFTATSSFDLGITNLNTANLAFDVASINGTVFVAYNNNATGISVVTFTSSSSIGSATNISGNDANNCITVFGDPNNNRVWVIWNGSNGTWNTIRDFAFTTVVKPPTLLQANTLNRVTGAITSTNSAAVVAERSDGVILYNFPTSSSSSGFNVFTSFNSATKRHTIGLASKAVSRSGQVYFWIAVQSALQPTYLMICFDGTATRAVVGKVASGTAGGLPVRNMLPEFTLQSGSTYLYPYLQTDLVTAESGNILAQQGVSLASVAFASFQRSAEIADSLHLSGVQLSQYDGKSLVEHGFNLYPELGAITQSTTGGSIAGGVTHQYVAVYEWMDAKGNVHRSAPSVAASVAVPNTTNTNSISIPVPPLEYLLTNKIDAGVNDVLAGIGLYRTTGNGSIFYRVNATYGAAYSGFDGTTLVYTDTAADASITGNEILYTTNGEVANGATPPALCVATYRNRLILVPADDPTSFWYSKQIVEGAPAEFSPLLVQAVSQQGGPIAAVASMDEKLVFFKASDIFYEVADGPTVTGSGNDFTQGIRINTDSGTTVAASVVEMPDGIMFQSTKGISLLDRNLGVHYVGAEVEGYFTSGVTVTSAVLYPGPNQVRFTLSSGVCLVYDYHAKDPETGIGQWSVFTNLSAVSATQFQSLYTYAKSDGTVLQESPSTFTDNGTFYAMKATTAWISLAGVQGFQRIYKASVLGTYKGAHTLKVDVAYDYLSSTTQSEAIVVSSPPTTAYQYRVLMNRQKCESIQFTIQDYQTSGFNEGFQLSSLALEVGIKSGINRAAQTQTYG
jgi:hypothetical protein